MPGSSAAHGGSVNRPFTNCNNLLALGVSGGSGGILPPARPPADQWEQFLALLLPSTRLLLSTRARLRQIHAHGWTIAVAPEFVRVMAERRDRLESALTRMHGGSPKTVHIVELGQ